MGEIEDLLLEIAWKNYDFCFNSKIELENKSNMILAVTGILLGLIFNGLALLNRPFAYLSCIFLLISALYCVNVLKLKTYQTVGVMKTWNELKERQILHLPLKAKKNIFASIDDMVKSNWESYNDLIEKYRIGLLTFQIGLISLVIAIIMPLFVK
jgi:hypothetical protein